MPIIKSANVEQRHRVACVLIKKKNAYGDAFSLVTGWPQGQRLTFRWHWGKVEWLIGDTALDDWKVTTYGFFHHSRTYLIWLVFKNDFSLVLTLHAWIIAVSEWASSLEDVWPWSTRPPTDRHNTEIRNYSKWSKSVLKCFPFVWFGVVYRVKYTASIR